MISKDGYRIGAKGYNDPFNIIPGMSGIGTNISMLENNGMPLRKGPLFLEDNFGNFDIGIPGMEHINFAGDYVKETPIESREAYTNLLKRLNQKNEERKRLSSWGFLKGPNASESNVIGGAGMKFPIGGSVYDRYLPKAQDGFAQDEDVREGIVYGRGVEDTEEWQGVLKALDLAKGVSSKEDPLKPTGWSLRKAPATYEEKLHMYTISQARIKEMMADPNLKRVDVVPNSGRFALAGATEIVSFQRPDGSFTSQPVWAKPIAPETEEVKQIEKVQPESGPLPKGWRVKHHPSRDGSQYDYEQYN